MQNPRDLREPARLDESLLALWHKLCAFVKTHKRRILFLLNLVLSAALLGLSLGAIARYIVGPSEGFYTSDCTDTLWWANASYESGKLISPTFGYAALLPFGGSLLMLPFIPIFGVSMTTQKIGMLLFLCILVAAIAFLARSLGMGLLPSSLTVFCTTLLLSQSAKLREIMWEHIIYYSLGILFFCVGLGVLFRLRKALAEGSRNRILLWGVLLFVFTALTATNGLQSLVTWTLPVVFGVGMVWLLDEKREGFWRRTRETVSVVAGIGIATLFGLALLGILSDGVKAAYADGYSVFSSTDAWVDNLLRLPKNWYTLFGVQTAEGESIKDAAAIVKLLRILLATLLPLYPITALLGRHKPSRDAVAVTVYAHIGVTLFLLFACIFGALGGANWRLVPMLGTSILATAAVLFDRITSDSSASRRIAVLLLILVFLVSLITMREVNDIPFDYGRDNAPHTVVAELEARGLTKGYASFWKGHLMTLLSDGEVELRDFSILDRYINDKLMKSPVRRLYQSEPSWFDDTGLEQTFLLLDAGEASQLSSWLAAQSDRITERFELTAGGTTWRVYVFSGGVPLEMN